MSFPDDGKVYCTDVGCTKSFVKWDVALQSSPLYVWGQYVKELQDHFESSEE